MSCIEGERTLANNQVPRIIKYFLGLSTKAKLTAVTTFMLVWTTFVLAFNFNLESLTNSEREPSSVEAFSQDFEKSFIRELSRIRSRSSSGFGSSPSKLDILQFEVLRGRYEVVSVEDRIIALKIKPGEDPIDVGNSRDFLSEYQGLLVRQGEALKPLNTSRNPSSTIESYEVLESGDSKARLDLEFGANKELLELKLNWR